MEVCKEQREERVGESRKGRGLVNRDVNAQNALYAYMKMSLRNPAIKLNEMVLFPCNLTRICYFSL